MKKIFMPLVLTVLTIVAVFSSCKTEKAATTPSGDNPMTFSSEAQNITVVLEGNTTTGYSWSYKIKDNSIVQYVSDEYKTNNTSPMMMGAGGKHYFVFKAVKQGSTTITFDYARHWNGGQTAGIRVIKVTVDGNLNVKTEEVTKGK